MKNGVENAKSERRGKLKNSLLSAFPYFPNSIPFPLNPFADAMLRLGYFFREAR
jgi:hypothetical protein